MSNENTTTSEQPTPAAVRSSDGLGRRMRIFLRFGKYLIFTTGFATIFIPVTFGICFGLEWLLGKWIVIVPIGIVVGGCLLGAWAEEEAKDKSP